ncbi:MAG TPA: hypothetical protein RMH85_22295 [Polyangiaceae bacterium LLY-WYZ-15_(1-7)]|nr:hypothetical protein [Sandaracinus sp.]HJK91740.1 hypothetical protein [Polyangiaceae bacterium LLY-WYZ-15_(1-7)]MBJ70582.1 hypothetical protein [Sandaracinus sp.]HJL03285.1 hypothetical protein [Polyangiaceae bacterium LLY-WYZ-15_(1-7)]HJL11221.1 hypothetical protein [Polyangiaceae bacterium LLY-WYZ-15_(1-7)]
MGDSIEKREKSGGLTLRDIFESEKLTAEHLTSALQTVDRVVEARLELANMEAASIIRLRELHANLQRDLTRADEAVQTLEKFINRLPPELVGLVVKGIIETQLGRSLADA